VVIPQNVKKKSKSLHPSVQFFEDFFEKSRWRNFFHSQSEAVTTAIEKNPGKGPPAIVFFAAQVP
jgi:hypothetical protein